MAEFQKVFEQPYILLTGAGASASFGYPTIREFAESVLLPITNSDTEHGEILGKLFVLSEKLMDFETLLDFLEDEKRMPQNAAAIATWAAKYSIKEDINEVFLWTASLRERLRQTHLHLKGLVCEIYGKTPDEQTQQQVSQAYKNLILLLTQEFPKILPCYTTNYDPTLEYGLRTVCSLNDGFGYGGRWDRSNLFLIKPGDQTTVCVMKLHGSVGYTVGGEDIYRHLGTSAFNQNTSRIVFPTSMKTEQITSTEPCKTYYEFLRRGLTHAKWCIVIGFSMRDTELTTLLGQGLTSNEDLKLIIADVDPTIARYNLQKRVGEALPRSRMIELETSFPDASFANKVGEVIGL